MFSKLFGAGKDDINLSAAEFKSLMKHSHTEIIDVRTPEEFQSGHIQNAVNIDFYEDFEARVNDLDKSKNYLLYCRSGSRSYSAVKLMKSRGFNHVRHLEPGILGWDLPLSK